MKFTCEKALLQSAVNMVFRTAAAKSTIPALEGILIEAGHGLTLTGYNMQTGIRTRVSADVSREGCIVIDAKLFSDLIRKLPDDVVSVSVSNDFVAEIRCGVARFEIMCMDAADYPDLPEVDAASGLQLEEEALRSMINGAVFCASESEARPVHTGMLFDYKSGTVTGVAVDGYRLALRREDCTCTTGQDMKFVVPAVSLRELEKILTGGENIVTMIPGKRHILFKTENAELISRLLDGEFLNYDKAVPRANPITFNAATRDIAHCVDRVSLIINESLKSPVRMTIGDGQINFASSTALGSVSDSCQIVGTGGDMEIGFNNRYLLDALKAVPDDEIKIELSGPTAPMIIVPKEGAERYLYMILPVRLRKV